MLLLKMKRKKITIPIAAILIAAVGTYFFIDENHSSSENPSENFNKQSLSVIDTVSKSSKASISTHKVETLNEQQESEANLTKIESQYGQQWDFCTCVKKNDSLDRAFKSELSDEEFEILLKRFDYIDQHCKAFLAGNPNLTPEQREEHKEKVRKCLEN